MAGCDVDEFQFCSEENLMRQLREHFAALRTLPPERDTGAWIECFVRDYSFGSSQQLLPAAQLNDMKLLADIPLNTNFRPQSFSKQHPFRARGPIRRDCFLFFYLPINCPRATDCPDIYCALSHSVLEKMFHPLIIRTEKCKKGANCSKVKCSFLHGLKDMDEVKKFWQLWETWWLGFRAHTKLFRSVLAVHYGGGEPLEQALKSLDVVMSARLVKLRRSAPHFQRALTSKLEAMQHSFFELRLAFQWANALVNEPQCARVKQLRERVAQQVRSAHVTNLTQYYAPTASLTASPTGPLTPAESAAASVVESAVKSAAESAAESVAESAATSAATRITAPESRRPGAPPNALPSEFTFDFLHPAKCLKASKKSSEALFSPQGNARGAGAQRWELWQNIFENSNVPFQSPQYVDYTCQKPGAPARESAAASSAESFNFDEIVEAERSRLLQQLPA